jgi:hypothetical protein
MRNYLVLLMKIKTYHELQLVVGLFPTIQRSTCNMRRIDIYCTYCISRNCCCTFAKGNVRVFNIEKHMVRVKNTKKFTFQTKL